MKEKILVTGGCGYIGSLISSNLVKKYHVFVLDNLSNVTNNFLNKNVVFVKLDLSNYSEVKKFLKKFQFKKIIHLAAKKSVTESEKNKIKYYKENVLNTIHLFDVANSNGLKYFIFMSSAAVYGKCNSKISIKNKTKPLSFYGLTKLNVEKYLVKKSKKSNIKIAILRLFNAAGADLKSKSGNQNKKDLDLFSHIINCFELGKVFNLFGNRFDTKDGTCVRNFIHIKDISNIVSKVLVFLSNYKKNIILINVCSEKAYSISQVIKSFEFFYKRKLSLSIQNKRTGEIIRSEADYSFIKKKLKYKCKYSSLSNLVKSSVLWSRFFTK
jgi:UDP-glucose 4-epimerase